MHASKESTATCDSPSFHLYTDYALDVLAEQLEGQELPDETMADVICAVYAAVRLRQDTLDVHMGAIKRSIAEATIGVLADKTVIPF